LEAEERRKEYDRPETFSAFSRRVAGTRDALLALLGRLRAEGCAVAGYGASGRANTVIQYCGLSREHLVYMIDDAPAKQGYFTPGSHIPIYSSEMLRKPGAPPCILVFAWSFLAEIAKRNAGFLQRGGKMIVPLPEVRIHSFDGVSSAT
jgi:hypothetical protein